MGGDQCGGVGLRGASNDVAQRRADEIHRTLGDESIVQKGAPAVQVEHSELFLREPAEPLPQVIRGGAGARELKLGALRRHRDAAGDLHRRQQLSRLGPLQSLDLQQGQDRGLHRCPQRPKPFEQVAGEFDRTGALEVDADEDGHQFRVREGLRPARKQALAWAFLLRPGGMVNRMRIICKVIRVRGVSCDCGPVAMYRPLHPVLDRLKETLVHLHVRVVVDAVSVDIEHLPREDSLRRALVPDAG